MNFRLADLIPKSATLQTLQVQFSRVLTSLGVTMLNMLCLFLEEFSVNIK
jgi:hypothetical protein